MENANLGETISLTIGRDEAVILFELLASFHRQSALEIKDDAERISLVRLSGALESTLVEPFSPEYRQIVEAARKRLLENAWLGLGLGFESRKSTPSLIKKFLRYSGINIFDSLVGGSQGSLKSSISRRFDLYHASPGLVPRLRRSGKT